MKKLITSLCFILSALFAIDRLGEKLLWWSYQHANNRTINKSRYLMNELDDDMVLLGSSRCYHHYVPSILADSLSMSVYNLGQDGAATYYHYLVLHYVLNHHTPKVVCLDLISSDYLIDRSTNPFKRVHSFAPFVGQDDELDKLFKTEGTYAGYAISHSYRFSSLFFTMMIGLVANTAKDLQNGYLALPSPHELPKMRTDETAIEIDTMQVIYLNKIIELCEERNITLVFSISPYYTQIDGKVYDFVKDISKAHGIPFFDYHTSKLFHNKSEYFKDAGHLCGKGAHEFTSIFAHDLKRALKK